MFPHTSQNTYIKLINLLCQELILHRLQFFSFAMSPKSIGHSVERGRNVSETVRRVKTFSLLHPLFFSSETHCLPPDPANEGAIYQKPYAVSRLNFILCHLSYFLATTRTKHFFPTRKIDSSDEENRAYTLDAVLVLQRLKLLAVCRWRRSVVNSR